MREARVGVMLPFLLAFVVPVASGQAVGTWAIDAGPVADGDSSMIEIVGTGADAWGRWVRFGDHPVVAIRDVRYDFDTHVLTATAVMGSGEAKFVLTESPWRASTGDLSFSGEWSRGTERVALRGRWEEGVSSAMRAASADIIQLVMPGVLSTAAFESFNTFSADGTELYFTRHQPNFSAQRIFVARQVNGTWQEPVMVPFSGKYNDREPRLSPDGRRLFFSSNRPVAPDTAWRRDLDLWMVERQAGGQWGEPIHLPSPVNTDKHEFCPVETANGTLYFISTRSDTTKTPHSIWRVRKVNGTYGIPERLDRSVSIGGETNVYVTPDEKFMVASRDGAADSEGGDDLYLGRASGGRWSPLEHMAAGINTWAYEYGPTLSADGTVLYFTSDRRGTADLYRVTLGRE